MEPTEVVAITGSSGLLAQHLIAYLQNNSADIVKEIRAIDRKPFRKFLDYPSSIPIRFHKFDICDEIQLERTLSSCTTVFHCAGKSFEYIHSEKQSVDHYCQDNVNATESLIDVMKSRKIPRVIHVGDAYSFLPPGDNYGHSEYMQQNLPSRFMLGLYGESKARAELVVRKAAQEGEVHAIILRPVLIYGEGEKHLISMAKSVCAKNGGIPVIDGDDRGNHQFIYAGNMAAIMEKTMRCLANDPSKYNNEVVICIDQTRATTFSKFITPYMELSGFKQNESQSYMTSFISAAHNELLAKIGSKVSIGCLTLNAHRFLNGWTVGFCNRKLRLLLDFVPPVQQKDAMERSLEWFADCAAIEKKQKSIIIATRSRTG